ncbi:MAG: ArsA family ATPase [Nocardioides sp.]|uniref:ArsA family ATPase n=1 Tax=Nocardioides sp. TaxID=35761 RepID=UPI003D6BFD51
MLLSLTRRRRVLFVGGKGGVGKTSVASALALAHAREGARVLVVSTDPAHNLGHLWDLPVRDDATRLASPGTGLVDGIEIDPESVVSTHLKAVRETMHRMLPDRLWPAADRHLELAREAPGTHESAIVDRVAETLALGLADYDLVVYDTAPSGHTLRLLAMPEHLTGWTESLLASRDRAEKFAAAIQGLGGKDRGADRDAELRRVLVRRRERFATLRDTIRDPGLTSFVVVTTAERLPVLESLALHEQLVKLGIDVGSVVVNRRSPADAGPLLAGRRRLEDAETATLREALPDTPLLELPLLPGALTGPLGVGVIADACRVGSS